jgi:hypothetical protein
MTNSGYGGEELWELWHGDYNEVSEKEKQENKQQFLTDLSIHDREKADAFIERLKGEITNVIYSGWAIEENKYLDSTIFNIDLAYQAIKAEGEGVKG